MKFYSASNYLRKDMSNVIDSKSIDGLDYRQCSSARCLDIHHRSIPSFPSEC